MRTSVSSNDRGDPETGNWTCYKASATASAVMLGIGIASGHLGNLSTTVSR